MMEQTRAHQFGQNTHSPDEPDLFWIPRAIPNRSPGERLGRNGGRKFPPLWTCISTREPMK